MAIPSGEIYLLKNVPLTASYEHTIDFKDKNEQFNYFTGFIKYTFSKYTYIRKEREFLTVELPVASLDDINYLIFKSADGERLYYAFVGNKRFINGDVTEISYEIDVMQTYMFDYKWNASYIKQAHVDRWTADHKPVYSKTDEGLDYGTEYSVENAFYIEQSKYTRWFLVSLKDYSAVIDEGYAGDTSKFGTVYTPFSTLLIPAKIDTSIMDSVYHVTLTEDYQIGDYNDFLKTMLNGALGEYIQGITLLPYNPLVAGETIGTGRIDLSFHAGVTVYLTKFKGVDSIFMALASIDNSIYTSGLTLAQTDWDDGITDSMPTPAQWAEIKKNPYTTKRDKRFESKLLCSPYRYNLLTDWRNVPVMLKNEYMTDDKITVKYSYALSYNAPFRYWVDNYKRDPEGRNASLIQSLGLEMPVVSDAYYTYMLQNKNTIQTNIENSIVNAGMGALTGVVHGGVVGGAMGLLGGTMNVLTQIESENAKQADIATLPTNILKGTDSAFNIVDKNAVITFYRMRICCENEEIIANIFNMAGYKVNRVDVPNLRSRTRYNYIQTMGANITGAFSQTDLLKIKSIFDNGITIWHYNKTAFNPLDYSYENIEVNLI